ncbi:YceI family protein [Carboxylicivirga sp. N1Y90]|uniref:YceI family protein n=1 Tax=Carboxylicivirga fragile TaxID=3417571 RepID=UPI003D34AC47|nr:YceI family protein [Marinilabiliaceae bacterium N1Y90]
MKTILIAVISIFSITAISSQEKSVDTQKSTLHWDAQKVTGEHNGTISFKNGQLQYKNDELTSATFVVDMTSITCSDIENEEYNKKLVGHLKSDDFFGVSTYPTSKLVINKFSKTKNGYIAKGNLTIKNKTNPVEFEVTLVDKKLKGKLVVDRSLYDVKYGSGKYFDNLGDKMIYDEFELDFVVLAK